MQLLEKHLRRKPDVVSRVPLQWLLSIRPVHGSVQDQSLGFWRRLDKVFVIVNGELRPLYTKQEAWVSTGYAIEHSRGQTIRDALEGTNLQDLEAIIFVMDEFYSASGNLGDFKDRLRVYFAETRPGLQPNLPEMPYNSSEGKIGNYSQAQRPRKPEAKAVENKFPKEAK